MLNLVIGSCKNYWQFPHVRYILETLLKCVFVFKDFYVFPIKECNSLDVDLSRGMQPSNRHFLLDK